MQLKANAATLDDVRSHGILVCGEYRAGRMGTPLGLEPKWPANVIRAVGNHGGSFERNVGPGSALKLQRGFNRLWTNGGLMQEIPFR